MKTILILILVLATLDVAGQNHLTGVTGGANWTNATSNNFINNTDHRFGITGGITYEYFLKEQFSIGVDITFNQRGFTDEVEHPADRKLTKFDYDYLSIPVKLVLRILMQKKRCLVFPKLGWHHPYLLMRKQRHQHLIWTVIVQE